MFNRAAEIDRRISLLIRDFERYLRAFDENPAFRKAGQLERHVETIRIRNMLGSATNATRDEAFLKSLYLTLQAWGIGRRGSNLANFDAFASAIRQSEPSIQAMEGQAVDDPELNLEQTSDRVWRLIESLDIVNNQARLVPCTKTLHHLLPDLVVPMDRAFTATFFGWHRPEFQYQQKNVFRHAFVQFAKIGRETKPSQFIGLGWRTSRTKILDNALVGFCQVEKLGTPT